MNRGTPGDPDRRRVICVMGMHRSGTSLIARMVNLLGVELGPEERLFPPQADNPKGFFEYIPFVLINERILDRHGGRWHAPPELAASWWRSPRALDLKLRVRALARRDFRDAPLWGWKDPRVCLTLPFWRSIYPDLIAIICLRNPLDVARSLEKREGMPIEQGLWLWELYLAGALEHSEGCTRLVVSYEDALSEPVEACARIGRVILGEEGSRRALAAAPQLADLVDPEMQHGSATSGSLLPNTVVPDSARELYGELLEMAEDAAVERASVRASRRP